MAVFLYGNCERAAGLLDVHLPAGGYDALGLRGLEGGCAVVIIDMCIALRRRENGRVPAAVRHSIDDQGIPVIEIRNLEGSVLVQISRCLCSVRFLVDIVIAAALERGREDAERQRIVKALT